MHYRLRPIKDVQFGFAHFVSHFIRVQIFQIDFPLILSASKYFRYISLSFYICRGQNEHFSINSVRKTGRVELCQIFDLSDWCTDICKTQFPTFKPQFHHEVGLVEQRYFELFSRHGLYFHPTKDRCSTRPTSTFLYICCNFGQIFCANVIQFFFCVKYGSWPTQKVQQISLCEFIGWEIEVYFQKLFVPFLTNWPS